jgi:hypothetical protein
VRVGFDGRLLHFQNLCHLFSSGFVKTVSLTIKMQSRSVINKRDSSMQRIEYTKLSPEEEAGLRDVCKKSQVKYGDLYATLGMSDAPAKFFIRQRMQERGEKSIPREEIKREMEKQRRGERWAKGKEADWELLPELRGLRLEKHKPLRTPMRIWIALERFVQLHDGELDDFYDKYRGFLPKWFYPSSDGNNGEMETGTRLRATGHVWVEEREQSSRLKVGGWRVWQALLRAAWHSGFHQEYVAQLVNIPTTPSANRIFDPHPVYDAQRAVLAMMTESWRARFCPRCGVPFVAREEGDKYWPKQCFTENRRITQRASKEKMRRKQPKTKRSKARARKLAN